MDNYSDGYYDLDDFSSKAERKIDILEANTVGGIGQLIYHLFRFEDYEYDYDRNNQLIVRPICKKDCYPEICTDDFPTGANLFVSVYNLAQKINATASKKECAELIVDWCKNNVHPYNIDYIYDGLLDNEYNFKGGNIFLENDAVFSIDSFMYDLEKFYNAATFNYAFEQMCLGNDDVALALSNPGKQFSGLPLFEKFRYNPNQFPKVDYSSAKGDLLKEMQLDSAMRNQINVSEDFVRVPFDYYEQLQETLMEMIPDFRIRLKINHKTRKAVFAADINSIFDICMYTLARKISDDVAPEERTDFTNEYKGIVISCPFCGDAFVRKSNRAVTCGKEECNKARKRMNKQNSRKKARINSAK